MNANVRTIGGAIGAATVGSIITLNLQASGLPDEASYTLGSLVLAGVSLAAVLAAAAVPSGARPAPVNEP